MSKHILEENILTSIHWDKGPYRQHILKKKKDKTKQVCT